MCKKSRSGEWQICKLEISHANLAVLVYLYQYILIFKTSRWRHCLFLWELEFYTKQEFCRHDAVWKLKCRGYSFKHDWSIAERRIKMNEVIVVPNSVVTNVYSGKRNILFHTTQEEMKRSNRLFFVFFYKEAPYFWIGEILINKWDIVFSNIPK